MSKIFISYRREDTADVTGRIHDWLVQQFGREAIFMDVEDIPPGVDIRIYLDEQVAKCDVFLAVIGRDWMKLKGRTRKPRLEETGDFVRIEIESALKHQILVIPVLVQGVKIPEAARLPSSIQELSYRNSVVVRPGLDFRKDMDRLIVHLRKRGKATQAGLIAPLDMVQVLQGPFLYGEQKTREIIDHDYWIDKYPVTNEKYREFILAGGYEVRRYWSYFGWKWKTEHYITLPEYWNDARWSKINHPVVGVSYYEAEAYATWAGKRLPTEQEWEKAARGVDGRWYPWGEEFDKNKCNSRESGSGHTTTVSQYPNGVSSYGCYDMAGNVWEWCASWYDESAALLVVRGGSWFNVPVDLRVSSRHEYNVVNRLSYLGFRLVQDIP